MEVLIMSRERDGWTHVEVPVVFFNGEDQIQIGNGPLEYPSTQYSKLESSVGEMVGFSLNDLSIYRVKNPFSQNPDDDPPKITVAATVQSNPAESFSREYDVILLVVFNRSRMARTAFGFPRTIQLNLEDLRRTKRSCADLVEQKNTVAPTAPPPGIRPVQAGVGSSSSSSQNAIITYPEPMDDPEVRAWLEKRFEPVKANPYTKLSNGYYVSKSFGDMLARSG